MKPAELQYRFTTNLPASNLKINFRGATCSGFSYRRLKPALPNPVLFRGLNRVRHDVTGFVRQAGALELNGDMRDVEIFFELGANRLQNFFAFVHVHVRDAHVAGERHQIRPNRPDMNVVDFLHALDAQDGTRHGLELNSSRQAFEQDVAGLLQEALGGPEHQRGDGHADQRIDPLRSRHTNGDGAHKNTDVRNRVAEVVNQQAAEIQIAPAADARERDPAVDDQGQHRDPDHPVFVDGDGMKETFERFIEKTERDQDQQNCVGKRGQNAGALIAVGTFVVRGPYGPVQSDPGNQQSGNVGQIVECVANQGNGVAQVAAQKFRDD